MERGQGDSWRPQYLEFWMPYAPQGLKGFDDDSWEGGGASAPSPESREQ